MEWHPENQDEDDPLPAAIPPDDEESPYEWIDAEWLPDSWERTQPIEPTSDVARFRRTTAGSILAAGLLGLEKALMPERSEEPAITWEAPGEPPGPRHLEFDLDPDDPSASTVTVRPWMSETPPAEG